MNRYTMADYNRKLAGAIVFAGSGLFLLGMVVAEAMYPGYSISENYISDLGIGPSAHIFNTAVIIFGLAVLAGIFLLRDEFRSRIFLLLLAFSGIGSIGVGIFPETIFYPHAISAFTTFTFGGLGAIIASRFIHPPFSYISAVLGVISLAALLLLVTGNHLDLGAGGMERLIAYPLVIWALGFGGWLMGSSINHNTQ